MAVGNSSSPRYSRFSTGQTAKCINGFSPENITPVFARTTTRLSIDSIPMPYEKLLSRHSTLGNFVQQPATDASQALEVICGYFSSFDVSPIIPHDSRSACKRLCMFMRWMVRSNSPVDLGLWSQFIDCRSLIIPLDTHVLAQAKRLGLLKSQSPSMHTAIQLTQTLKEIFPHDPLLGDFALFGYGVNH